MRELVRALREGDRGQGAGSAEATEKSDGHCCPQPGRPTPGTVCPLCGVVLTLLGPSRASWRHPHSKGPDWSAWLPVQLPFSTPGILSPFLPLPDSPSQAGTGNFC